MRPKVVICGSFHRSTDFLERIFRELEVCGCRILSPLNLNFTNVKDEFVRTKNESRFPVETIETFHLKAILEADFIFLHCPDGYLGTTASFELGFAYSLQKPVFCFQTPLEDFFQSITTQVKSVFEALERLNLNYN